MTIHGGIKVAGAVALGVGAAVLLGACTGRREADKGPMGDLSGDLMRRLQPSWKSGGLDLATQSVRAVRGDDGAVRGSYDGTRLLQAADEHRHGTPELGSATVDVRGDGTATFEEVRQVVRHFDVDMNGGFDRGEAVAFEQAVGIRWLPA